MKHWITALLLFACLPLFAGAAADVRKGDKLFHRKKYGQALSAYQNALKQHPGDEKATFGVGAASYYLKDYNTAEQAFENINARDEKTAQDALFNLGTAHYRAKNSEKAKSAYRQLLLKNPTDKETFKLSWKKKISQKTKKTTKTKTNKTIKIIKTTKITKTIRIITTKTKIIKTIKTKIKTNPKIKML